MLSLAEKEFVNVSLEANRCLYCYDAPCIKGCPAGIDIPEFIKAVREKNNTRAARIIYRDNPLGAICGEICPAETLCMGKCVQSKIGKPVNIPMIQRYACAYAKDLAKLKSGNNTKKKVAVIGAGPAGLAAAEFLAQKGVKVKIFEKEKHIGGVLNSTLPLWRLSNEAKELDFSRILSHGITISYNSVFGKDLELKKLLREYYAVIIAGGLMSKQGGIEGSRHQNVFTADDFLKHTRKKAMKPLGNHVVIIGGGDVAMDCAVAALDVAKKVSIYYRRSIHEMPASPSEMDFAHKKGISFNYLSSPLKVNRNNDGELFIDFIENTVVPGKTGKLVAQPMSGTQFKVKCNAVVFAIGYEQNLAIFKKTNIAMDKNRSIVQIGDDYQTSLDNVFLAGDMVTGGGSVVECVKIAKEIAQIISEEF